MSDFASKTYYEMLGLPRDANEDQIKSAYHELARMLHPDSNFFGEILDGHQASSDQLERFKLVTNAYQTLINTVSREEYDLTLEHDPDAYNIEEEPNLETQSKLYGFVLPETEKKKKRRERKPTISGAYGTFGTLVEPEKEEVIEVSPEVQSPKASSSKNDNPQSVSDIIKKERRSLSGVFQTIQAGSGTSPAKTKMHVWNIFFYIGVAGVLLGCLSFGLLLLLK